MAKIELNLTKNTNEAIEGTYGKYYARVENKSTIGVETDYVDNSGNQPKNLDYLFV